MAVRINKDDLTTEQKTKIRKDLYMQPKKTGYSRRRRYVQTKDPILLWHIDKPKNEIILPYSFCNSLLKKNINATKNYPGGNFNFTGTLRDYQESIIIEAMDHLNKYGTTTLSLYPGAGKTILSAYLSCWIGGLILAVYPIKTVETGWINTFLKFTDAQIWHNDGKNPIPKNCNVIVTMDTQFHKIPKPILDMVKVLIIDEAHMFCVPSRIHCLLGTCPLYVISCTATLKRDNGMESIIHSVCGKHEIFRKSTKRYSVYKIATGIKTEIKLNKMGEPDWSQLVKDLWV